MSANSLPLSRPTLGEEEIREIIEVIQSGWITSGPRVERFEEDFARHMKGGCAGVDGYGVARATDHVVSLPLFPGMSDPVVGRVCEAIRAMKKGSGL
jgi:UDP-4-amino-4-deoxy-L-arabinose-oxoglutarate aminotransferase